MSYDVSLCVKVEGIDKYVDVTASENITWNVGELIKHSSGWDISANNCKVGMLASEWVDLITDGMVELMKNPEAYREYEALNGWGTVEGTLGFFERCYEMAMRLFKDEPLLYSVARVRVG